MEQFKGNQTLKKLFKTIGQVFTIKVVKIARFETNLAILAKTPLFEINKMI